MIIGTLKLDFYIHGNSSLKGKRRVLKSLKDRMRRMFNVSVAEIDNHDKWQRATIGVALLGRDKSSVNSALDNVLNFMRDMHEIELGTYDIELI